MSKNSWLITIRLAQIGCLIAIVFFTFVGVPFCVNVVGVITRNHESAQIDVGDGSNSGIFEMTAQKETQIKMLCMRKLAREPLAKAEGSCIY